MSQKTLTLSTPPSFQCYECIGCGDCCRGRFAIRITQQDRERIEAQGWGNDELDLQGKPLFLPVGNNAFQLAHDKQGACVFLTEDNKCRIHARFGESAKPLACRLYPFRYIPIGTQLRIDVRFDCPATAQNIGRPVSGYRPYLLKLMPQAITPDVAGQAPPPLFGKSQGAWAQYCRITETFERLLMHRQLDLPRRMLCALYLISALRNPRILSQEGRKFSDFLEKLAGNIIEKVAKDPLQRVPPPSMVRVAFRQLAGHYGRIDRVGERTNPLQRLIASWNIAFGLGTVPRCRPDFPTLTFAQIEQTSAPVSDEASATIERYLHMHLSSMSFFGSGYYNRSYLDGISGLLLTFPLICWYARTYAFGNGLATPDAACAARAIEIVDHQHGISPLLNMPNERFRANFLTERSHLRALIIWYGG